MTKDNDHTVALAVSLHRKGLINAVSKAGPGGKFNRAVDAEIAATLHPDRTGYGYGFTNVRIADAVSKYIDTDYHYLICIADIYDLPEFTASVDAALSLLPAGFRFSVTGFETSESSDYSYSAAVDHVSGELPAGRRPFGGATGRTPAQALVKAILRTVEGA